MANTKKTIRINRVASLLIAIVLTVVIAFAIVQKSGLPAYQLSKYVNDHYFKDTPFRFSCGKITGDMVGQVAVSNPTIRYQSGGLLYEVFTADRVSLDYNILQILKLRMIARDLRIERPRIRLIDDSNGDLIMPRPRVEGEIADSGVSPEIEVRRFVIQDAEFTRQTGGQSFTARDVNILGSLAWANDRGSIEIEQSTAFIVETETPVRELQTTIRLESGAIFVDDAKVRLENSFVMASGRYAEGRLHQVQAIFNPLDLGEVSAVGLMPENDGQVGGSVVVSGRPDSLGVKGSLTGRGFDLVFSGLTFEGAVTPERVTLSELEGTFFGSWLKGRFDFLRDDGSFAFDGECKGLDITQGFVAGGEAPETDLHGKVRVDYDAPEKTYRALADLHDSSVDGFKSDQLEFQGAWSEQAGLLIQSVTSRRDGFVLSGSGSIDEDSFAELILRLEGDSLDYLQDYLELPIIGGDVDLSGRLVGPLDRLQLNLNGSWNQLVYSVGRIDSSIVHAEARNIGSDDVVATINVNGDVLRLGGRTFTKPHLLLEPELTKLHVRDFSFSAGDTLVTTHVEIEPGDTSTVVIKHLLIRTPQTVWVNQRQAQMIVSKSRAVIDTFILHAGEHEIGIIGEYSFDDRVCDVTAWGHQLDTSLLGHTIAQSIELRGEGDFVATMKGDIDHPIIDFSLHMGRGVIDSLSFARLDARGGFNERGYYIDEFRIAGAADSLSLVGKWGYTDSPIRIIESGLSKDVAMNAPLEISVNSQGFSLGSLFRAAHQKVYWGGLLVGSLTVQNTLAKPHVKLHGEVLSTSQTRYRLPPISIEAVYKDGLLTIPDVSFDDGQMKGKLSGVVPIDLGLEEGAKFHDRAPIDLSADVSSKDLSALARYFKRIATSGGEIGGSVHITGPASKPSWLGTVKIKKGALRLAGMEENYRDVSADIRIDNSVVQVRSLTGSEGKKGQFSGTGTARVQGLTLDSYDVSLELKEFTVSSIPGFESTQDGKLRITSRQNQRGQTIPHMDGVLRVRHATITRPMGVQEGPPSPITLPSEAPDWTCKLDIDAPTKVWVRNPELDMELGGKLIMRRDQNGLYFRGDLDVLRGRYALYSNKFRITEGRIDFSATTLRPGIYLAAYTPHRQAGQEERRISLSLSWPPDKKEPTITLSYDVPGYSEADIWKMLGGQVVVGNAGTSAGEVAAGTAQNIASNYLERILSSQMTDMTIDIEQRTVSGSGAKGDGEQEMSIAVGRYLSEDLYLNYRQGLRFSSEVEVDIEYRISNMLMLRSEIIRHDYRGIPGKSNQATDEINFDLKFRFEY